MKEIKAYVHRSRAAQVIAAVQSTQAWSNRHGDAGQHNLTLTRRNPGAERQAGDLYETAISCDWEGDLEALVNFLYAQQAQGAVSDVRQLSVQPVGGRDVPAGHLKGNFTIDYAYRREAGATENKPEPAPSAPAEEPEQP